MTKASGDDGDGAVARGLLRRARSAALSTALASDGGRPYASLVTIAADTNGQPILLLSTLSDHTRNLQADDRASLLIEEASRRENPQTGARVTLVGRIGRSDEPRHRRRFLARHPKASMYAGFGDFAVYTMDVERMHLVGGFARSRWLAAQDVLGEPSAAAALAEAELSVIEHMNDDHSEAVDLYAQRLLGRRGNGWRIVAVDPEGCDLRRGPMLARLDFPAPVNDVSGVRQALVEMAARARRDI